MLNSIARQLFSIDHFLQHAVFPHEVTKLELLETHISWIVLTGPFAYKIKKPVTFDFLDYSTLEQRRDFCQRELELNRRFAPEIYLGVVPIFSEPEQMRVGNRESANKNIANAPIEYAVQMRQFSQESIAAAVIERGDISVSSVERLGRDLADWHDTFEHAPTDLPCVQIENILADALGNFEMLDSAFPGGLRQPLLNQLRSWTHEQFQLKSPLLQQRLELGRVRRCHGDMHLKNIVQWNDRLIPFDGIEFNEQFQWIDVINDVAFPVMDLIARRRADLAWRLLNAYLEATGDYDALVIIRFYLVYRALVRAKVTWLNPQNKTDDVRRKYSVGDTIDPLAGPWDKYLATATFVAYAMAPSLTITHGLSGSGKSTAALRVLDHQGGVRVRADVERHRLAAQLGINDKYTAEMNDRIYGRLLQLAAQAIEARMPIVIDATFLQHSRRVEFKRLAFEKQVPFGILDCQAPFEELCRRLRNRKNDASEATIEVLRQQMEKQDPLFENERPFVIAASAELSRTETVRQPI